MLPVADALRDLFSEFGVARYAVTVRRESWSGGRVGKGTATQADLQIVSAGGGSPMVTALTDINGRVRDMLLSGGTVQVGDMVVTEITPSYANVGPVAHVGSGTGVVTPSRAIPAAGLTAPGSYSVAVDILAGGATFQYSLDGSTWVGPLAIASSVPIPSVGVAMGFSGAFTAADSYSFLLACGGYTPLQLRPTIAPGVADDVYYVLVGDAGVEEHFTFVVARFDDPVGYMLVIRRREQP